MKWIFVNAIKHQDWGGMENWMLKLCTTLPSMGDPCLMVARPTSRWPSVCRESDIPYQPCPFGGDFSPWVTARLHDICREFKPDIAVVKGFRQARFLRQAWPHATIAVKLPAANELTSAWTDRLTFQHCVDRILVDNHFARSAFLQRPWVLPGKIVAVHNGVAIPDPAALPPERIRLRDLLRLPQDTPLIGASGRLVPIKAFDDAIRALAGLDCTAQPHLVIFGEGLEQPCLLALAEQLGLGSRVHLAGWQNDARRLLWGCDALIHPSLMEGLPNTVLESMAGGVPVVATAAGGTAEIFPEELADALVDPHDTDRMAANLSRLMNDSAHRLASGQKARTHVETNFSIPAMTAAIRKVLVAAAEARRSLRTAPARVPGSGGFWISREDSPIGPDSLDWQTRPDAQQVTRSPKTAVHHVCFNGAEYFLKCFAGSRFRQIGLRPPQAVENFRSAHRIFLRGARTVPHLGAGWNRRTDTPGSSTLVTGVLPGYITADQWIARHAPSIKDRRAFINDLARWMAHLHAAGVACHDLKYSNILVGPDHGPREFALLDLDNCRLRFLRATAHDIQRNLHQLFRSFQKHLAPVDVRRFLAVYRRTSGLSRQHLRRLSAVVEQRLCRRGTGYRELLRQKASGRPAERP